jgi:hypothetical protein
MIPNDPDPAGGSFGWNIVKKKYIRFQKLYYSGFCMGVNHICRKKAGTNFSVELLPSTTRLKNFFPATVISKLKNIWVPS